MCRDETVGPLQLARGGGGWGLARVFFRDERDAESTENSKVCALKRCRWRVYFLETKEMQRN